LDEEEAMGEDRDYKLALQLQQEEDNSLEISSPDVTEFSGGDERRLSGHKRKRMDSSFHFNKRAKLDEKREERKKQLKEQLGTELDEATLNAILDAELEGGHIEIEEEEVPRMVSEEDELINHPELRNKRRLFSPEFHPAPVPSSHSLGVPADNGEEERISDFAFEDQDEWDVPSLQCPICKREISIDQLFILDDCSHKFCRPCIESYVQEQITSAIYVVCPVDGCKSQLSVRDTSQLIKPLTEKSQGGGGGESGGRGGGSSPTKSKKGYRYGEVDFLYDREDYGREDERDEEDEDEEGGGALKPTQQTPGAPKRIMAGK
jgi:hypothetical protein